jgi:hypothetical protein
MDELGAYVVKEYKKVLPKSAIGKAFHYLAARYNKFYEYLQNGRLEIDNNLVLVENSIRPVALGRKNYLFAGSHAGAERAAVVYSLLGSCKLQGINPTTICRTFSKDCPNNPSTAWSNCCLLSGNQLIQTLHQKDNPLLYLMDTLVQPFIQPLPVRK